MITLSCDRCERTLEVPDEQAGRKVQCPHCGDVNVVPAGGGGGFPTARAVGAGSSGTESGAAGADRAAAMGLPPDEGPEKRVARIHPATFRAKPVRSALLILVTLGAIIGAAIFALRSPPDPVIAAVLGGVALVGLITMGVWKVASLSETLEITTKRLTLIRGLFSKHTSEIPLEDIKNLQIRQSFWQRLWGVGEIGASSSGQDEIEIVIGDIPRPYQVREMIDAYRNVMR